MCFFESVWAARENIFSLAWQLKGLYFRGVSKEKEILNGRVYDEKKRKL